MQMSIMVGCVNAGFSEQESYGLLLDAESAVKRPRFDAVSF
jgi:hypothetical protein